MKLFNSNSAVMCACCVKKLNMAAPVVAAIETHGAARCAVSAASKSTNASVTGYSTSFVSGSTTTSGITDASSTADFVDLSRADNESRKRKANPTLNLPKKRRDPELYKHVAIVELPCGGVSVSCNHCEK